MTGELLAINILTPAAAGIACYALRIRGARIVTVALASIVLIASSIMLSFTGGFSYSPPAFLGTVASFLGFALAAYFFYRGLRFKEMKILGLAAIQLLFLAFVELQGFNETSNIFIVDSLGVLMNIIINVIGSIVCVYSIGYMDEYEKIHQGNGRQPRFFLFMFLLLGAMNGLVFSNSIYWLALFWEVTTLCCFELIRHSQTEEAERNAATALWMSLVGGVALAGTLVISAIYYNIPAFDSLSQSLSSQSILFIFSLMAIAAFTKSAQFPFQKWLLGAMVAPTPVSALLHSSTMVNAGAYLILRIAPSLSDSPLTLVIAFGGALTFAITAVLAIRQRMAKSVLAYSTIGNLGLIILCAGLNTPLSYSAAIILLLFHSASKGMLFMGAGIVENRIESRRIEDWEGLMGRFPCTSIFMIIGMASMFLPPFGMLLGKWVALEAVASATLWVAVLLVMALVLGSTATTFFWVKWLGHLIVLPVAASKIVREHLQIPYLLSLVPLALLIIIVSIEGSTIVSNIVVPIEGGGYAVQIGTSLFGISTAIGFFPIWQLWLAFAMIFLVGISLARLKRGTVKPPYYGGENLEGKPQMFRSAADSEVKFSISGMFFDSIINESYFGKLAVIGGIAVIALMILVVVF